MPPPTHLVSILGGRASAPVHRKAAEDFYRPLLRLVWRLYDQELMSLRQIAAELDRRGIPTRYNAPGWSATQVRRVLARARADRAQREARRRARAAARRAARRAELRMRRYSAIDLSHIPFGELIACPP